MKRLKGSPRRATDERMRLHAMVKRIPDQATLDAFLDATPAALRGHMREMIAPHTRFDAREKR